jgi:TctA family transporter
MQTIAKNQMLAEKIKGLWPTFADWKASWKPMMRGSFLGFFLGLVPGGGRIVVGGAEAYEPRCAACFEPSAAD